MNPVELKRGRDGQSFILAPSQIANRPRQNQVEPLQSFRDAEGMGGDLTLLQHKRGDHLFSGQSIQISGADGQTDLLEQRQIRGTAVEQQLRRHDNDSLLPGDQCLPRNVEAGLEGVVFRQLIEGGQ